MTTVSLSKKKSHDVSPRLLEIRDKIHDELYISSAVQRIALVLSRKLVENNDIQRK